MNRSCLCCAALALFLLAASCDEVDTYKLPAFDPDDAITAAGWIGGGQDGWQTADAAPAQGDQHGWFDDPCGLHADGAGNLYVADSEAHCIHKWSSDGTALGRIGGGASGWHTNACPGGSTPSHFQSPEDVFVDAAGCIYVADTGNQRVSKWDAAGQPVGWIGGGQDGWQTGSSCPLGAAFDFFSGPCGVFVDAGGAIYVADANNCRISKWSAAGAAQGWIGSGLTGWQTSEAPGPSADWMDGYRMGHLESVTDVHLDAWGNLYAANGSRICRWSPAGAPLDWLGEGSDGWFTGTAPLPGDIIESEARDLSGIHSVHVAWDGTLYVTTMTRGLAKWAQDGTFLGRIGDGDQAWKLYGRMDPVLENALTTLLRPAGVFLASGDRLYVSDRPCHRVMYWQE